MIKAIPDRDERLRSEILSHIEEASYPHLSVLLARYFAKQAGRQAEREAAWHPLNNFLVELTGALCKSAVHLLRNAATDPSLKPPAAADAVRALHACRMLLKFHLVRYLGVPPVVWRMAYSVHRNAESADCAVLPVRMHTVQKTATTVNQELLLRLLMLQSCTPEMLTPEQIEVADWAIEQLGDDFTLRPPGVADNPFCFDPTGDGPPRRAAGLPTNADAGLRYFGMGTGYDALGRIHKQLATTGTAEIGTFGKARPGRCSSPQSSIWWGSSGAAPAYAPPERTPATGTLKVTHGYAQTLQHLSTSGTAKMELTLAQDGDVPAQAPEAWALKDTGGHEIGAEIPQRLCDAVRCGDVVCVSPGDKDGYWLGVIRALHAESARGLHASIFIIGRNPRRSPCARSSRRTRKTHSRRIPRDSSPSTACGRSSSPTVPRRRSRPTCCCRRSTGKTAVSSRRRWGKPCGTCVAGASCDGETITCARRSNGPPRPDPRGGGYGQVGSDWAIIPARTENQPTKTHRTRTAQPGGTPMRTRPTALAAAMLALSLPATHALADCYEIIDSNQNVTYRASQPPFAMDGPDWRKRQDELRMKNQHLRWQFMINSRR